MSNEVQDEINDFENECKEHTKQNMRKMLYIRYCLSCKKNICLKCYKENHNGHRTIHFDDLDLDDNTYNELKEKENKMKLAKEELSNKQDEIKMIYNKVKQLTNIINELQTKIKMKFEETNSNFKLNEKIIEYYDNNHRNYYILNKIKSLQFTTNDASLNLDILYEKINEFKLIGEKNMWISENYCKDWGLKEGIREFLQNQYDGIITEIKSKENLNIEKTGFNFTFSDGYDKSKIYGEIEYDKINKILLISNVGELCLADFLLGGLKEEQTNLDLIGHFGEGMKLAILAFCRLNKNVTIISSNKKYTFFLKEDINFKKGLKNIKCLHCKIENIKNDDKDYNEKKNQIKVLINNINEDEWSNEINNYLWLIEQNIEIYTTFGKDGKECGQIILEKYLEKKLYVKGIYVQEITKDDYEKDLPGFNSYNLKTNRDRNIIQDKDKLKENIAEIISELLNGNYREPKKFKKEKTSNTQKNYSYKESPSILYKFINYIESLIYCLDKNFYIFDSSTLASKLSNDSKNRIWNEVSSKHEKGRQPIDYEGRIQNFINEHKLSKDFYLTYNVTYHLYIILRKCSDYESIEDRYSKYKKTRKIISPDTEHQKALNEIYSILKVILKKDKINNIQFNEFEISDKNFCFSEDNKYILHSEKLKEDPDDEWKFWILVKIMKIENKNVEDFYENIYDLFQ